MLKPLTKNEMPTSQIAEVLAAWRSERLSISTCSAPAPLDAGGCESPSGCRPMSEGRVLTSARDNGMTTAQIITAMTKYADWKL